MARIPASAIPFTSMITQTFDASSPAIQVDGLHKAFGETHAVQGVSFNVRQGEIFSLLGPNGAGKTTTLSGIYI